MLSETVQRIVIQSIKAV